MGPHAHAAIRLLVLLVIQNTGVRSWQGLAAPSRLFGSVQRSIVPHFHHQLHRTVWLKSIPRERHANTHQRAKKNGETPAEESIKLGPETWTSKTSPFQVVRYYAREGVTDDEITACLAAHNITSLEKLKANGWVVGPLIMDGVYGDLSDSITVALKRNEATAVQILGGALAHDERCLSQDQLDLYSPAAVSMNYRFKKGVQVRCPRISLVMGPSGSGKTMFALKDLPTRAQSQAKSDQEIFKIHVTAKDLLGSKPNSNIKLSTRLVKHVQKSVEDKLWETFGKVKPPAIDLLLFVVIDEAGRTEYKSFFNESEKIDQLAQALANMKKYKFQKGVHVAVVGTALETTTALIDSIDEVRKYHMLPWKPSNFHALLDMLHREDKQEVKQIVERFTILNSLITNARCAYFLATTMPNITTTNEARWAGYVDITVPKVAYCYIQTNGLKQLVSPYRKFTVAQEAFRAIDAATRQPNVACYPSFDHIADPNLRVCTQSLLDINLDIASGETVLTVGSIYSVSMTPAIVVVLAELLCAKAQVCWDWRDFENAAALGEWKKMITEMDPSDFTDESGIIRLRSPVPGTRAKVTFTLPIIGRSTVLLNGPGAPYADVIAPFRFVQAKFSENTEQALHLNYDEEMGKMGLLNTDKYKLQQAASSVIYFMWQDKFKKGPAIRNEFDRFQKLRYREDVRSVHYPCQTLLSGDVKADSNLIFTVDFSNDVSRPTAQEGSTENPTEVKILEEFSEDEPVTAVFVTNLRSIVLTSLVRVENDSGNVDIVQQGISKEDNHDNGIGKEDNGAVSTASTGYVAITEDIAVTGDGAITGNVASTGDALGTGDVAGTGDVVDTGDVASTGDVAYKNVTYTIGRDDADWQGVLKKPLPNCFLQNLRKYVDVRFILY